LRLWRPLVPTIETLGTLALRTALRLNRALRPDWLASLPNTLAAGSITAPNGPPCSQHIVIANIRLIAKFRPSNSTRYLATLLASLSIPLIVACPFPFAA